MAVRDDLLPALTELIGPGARPLIGAAVSAAGGRLLSLERRQVLYRPGRRASVRFSASVSWAAAPPVGETFVAIVDAAGPPAGTLVVTSGELAVGLFRYPADPALPGLPAAVRTAQVAMRLGVAQEHVSLQVRTYRPGRRAVVRVRVAAAAGAAAGERYLKVVPPAEVRRLVDRLAMLAHHVPVPRVLDAWPDEGVVVLAGLPGQTMREVLVGDGGSGDGWLPDGDALLALLDAMPSPPAAPTRTTDEGPISRAAGHAALLGAVMPEVRDRLAVLLDRLGEPPTSGSVVQTHGDLHEAQILVADGAIAGLLDVDGAGPGRRVNDLATLLGHSEALAASVPSRRARVEAWRSRLLPAFDRAVDGADLRRTAAATLVGLATGPFRVQERNWRSRARRRIGMAEQWATAAGV